jgi:thioredoxin 1
MSIEFIDFHASWCGPCQNMAPIIDELKQEFQGKVKFSEVDIDEKPDVAVQYNVMSVPTYIIKKDDKIVEQFVGMQAKELLASKLS